jgi:hypothetical protein
LARFRSPGAVRALLTLFGTPRLRPITTGCGLPFGMFLHFAKKALQPNLILAHNTATTAAALEQTRTIPIVFAIVADPIGSGFIASLPRPGGNATGFTTLEPTMAGKWLELLKEIAPRVNRTALLFNPATMPSIDDFLNSFKGAAASLGVEAVVAPVHDTSALESVVSIACARMEGEALLTGCRPSGGFSSFQQRYRSFPNALGQQPQDTHK